MHSPSMNCETERRRHRAEQILAAIETAWDGNRLAAMVDQPLDAAMLTFTWSWPDRFCIVRWDNLLGRCMLHLYEHCQVSAVPASRKDACAMAVNLLNQRYRNEYDIGYDAAVTYVKRHGKSAVDLVLRALVEHLKTHWRELIMHAALSRLVTGLAWRDRQMIVDLIIERVESIIGDAGVEHLEDASPLNLPDLLQIYCSRHDGLGPLQQSHAAWMSEPLVESVMRVAPDLFVS